jgi:PhoPQ-activated pathogenicity-related protein
MRLTLLLLCSLAAFGQRTALDRYVNTPDPAYRYQLISTAAAETATVYVLEMVSQRWLSTVEVDRPEWRHWLIITRPAQVKHSTALLYINGGSNGGAAPRSPDPIMAAMAAETGAVVADLRMVPNQPLTFAGGQGPFTEDAIIAYSWDRYLNTRDDKWPARLPMVKATVRAMDTVSAFLAALPDSPLKIERFILSGGSKRGWTAWSAAAVDRRVSAVMPVVIDTLNVETSFVHHYRAYGFWAPAVHDYERFGVMNWFGRPEIRGLLGIEDPYEYRGRLALPKFIINSAGDQFFLPDSSQFYWYDLDGEKYLRYVPNTDHGMDSLEAVTGVIAYVDAFLHCRPRPRFTWSTDRSQGVIQLNTLDPPDAVKLWRASNPNARDFRREIIGRAWTAEAVKGEDGVYTITVPEPAKGFTAFFLEMTYPSGGKYPFVFTTEVLVTPNRYPFPPPPGAKP